MSKRKNHYEKRSRLSPIRNRHCYRVVDRHHSRWIHSLSIIGACCARGNMSLPGNDRINWCVESGIFSAGDAHWQVTDFRQSRRLESMRGSKPAAIRATRGRVYRVRIHHAHLTMPSPSPRPSPSPPAKPKVFQPHNNCAPETEHELVQSEAASKRQRPGSCLASSAI
jgi:hypothetical protein